MKSLLLWLFVGMGSVGGGLVMASAVYESPPSVETPFQATAETMATPPPSQSPAAVVQQQMFECPIFNDVFWYRTKEECVYWQNYWMQQSMQVPSYQSPVIQNPEVPTLKYHEYESITPEIEQPDFMPDYSDATKPPDFPPPIPTPNCLDVIPQYGRIENCD